MAQQNPKEATNLGEFAYRSRSGTYGEATTFEGGTSYGGSGKYDVDSLQYPKDLLQETNNPYGGNYVIFYVNVNEDSKLLRPANGRGAEEIVQDNTVRQRGEAVGLAKTQADALAGTAAVGGLAGGAAAKATGSTLRSGALAGGGIGLAAGALIGSQTSTFSRKQRRMKKAIALHTPSEMNIRYSMQWAEEDTATTAALFAGSEKTAGALGKMFSGDFGGAIKDVGAAIGTGKSFLTTAALKSPGAGEYVSALTGMVSNPKKEQLFKGVDFRTFTFTYQFFPRDQEEARRVRDIIKTFKLHMHPEFKDDYNFIYLYPSEFDIYYYQNGKENMNLHRHTSCVLTDMSINYAPQGTFTAFDDGMPSQINVVLTFKELALLTKDFIEDGF